MGHDKLQSQCELYRLLLHPHLSMSSSAESYIEKALLLVTQITGARIGYIEIRNTEGDTKWSTLHCDNGEVELIRNRISSSIIAESLETGETIITASAFLDDRFSKRQSVISQRIETVLCAPIIADNMSGVIYLQGDLDSALIERSMVDETELFSKNITPLLKRLKYHLSGKKPEDDLYEMYKLDEVVGNSSTFRKTLNEAMTVASLNVPLLFTGETGSGKSHLAKIVHENSSRADKPFVHINCANIPEKLFESELFGVSRGAYSGASMDMKGKVISADGGTLFLDEISEMPINAQAKFLQFLEEGFFYPLGSTTQLNPDVRIIVAANIDFIACIADKTFREDLYYRIANFPIHLPPLRHRSEDVFALAKFFINKYCEKYLLPVCELDPATLSKLSQHNWPGNIREFENCIQQGLVKAKIDGITVIKPEHILAGIVQAGEKEVAYDGSFQEQKSKWEKIFISAQLNVHDWNVSRTAVALEMSRSHLNKLIKLYELERR